jgi:hypothetical protein
MPTNIESYRAFRQAWTATPSRVPDIAVETDNVGGTTVYASWNGATEVRTWQVVSGGHAGALVPSGSVPKSGFETAITTHPKGPYLAVSALDAAGATLATSKVVRVPGA